MEVTTKEAIAVAADYLVSFAERHWRSDPALSIALRMARIRGHEPGTSLLQTALRSGNAIGRKLYRATDDRGRELMDLAGLGPRVSGVGGEA